MLSSQSPSKNVFTVAKLNRLARSILEAEIGTIWLSAEISNFVAASSGHWYFTLKDNRAQVRAAMFKGANRRLSIRPKEGDSVLVRANLSLYEPRGDYQLIVEHLEPAGQGLLKQQFEQLKEALASAGLFAQQHKQALPHAITRVGIVTSATGAALHDILTVLKRRSPSTEVILYPSQVQGDNASEQLCQAITNANRRNEVDVLIVGRGGGSLEDLNCFNQETLARAIFASHLPIVSAVGHEIDVSISDFVADVRAATPSAAAELVSQEQSAQLNHIEQLTQRLYSAYSSLGKDRQYQWQQLNHRLQQNHPQYRLRQQSQQIDLYLGELQANMNSILTAHQQRLSNGNRRLTACSAAARIERLQAVNQQQQQRLQHSMQVLLSHKQQQLAAQSQMLDSVSPLATLARGYNIAFKQGKIVKQASELQTGDEITSRFNDGEVISKVL